MSGSVYKIRLHRLAITLICCVLLVVLVQSIGWLVQRNEQQLRLNQLVSATRSQARLLGDSLSTLLQTENPDNPRISQMLALLTKEQRIPDASVYSNTGILIARAGGAVPLRDRLALNGNNQASQFNKQIVQVIKGKSGTVGFLRLTLDIRPQADEERRPDYLINLLRIFILLSLIIGVVLARTL